MVPPGMPPRPQHPEQPGQLNKLTRSQCPLDLDRVGTYHHHRVPPSTKGLPFQLAKVGGGRRA